MLSMLRSMHVSTMWATSLRADAQSWITKACNPCTEKTGHCTRVNMNRAVKLYRALVVSIGIVLVYVYSKLFELELSSCSAGLAHGCSLVEGRSLCHVRVCR